MGLHLIRFCRKFFICLLAVSVGFFYVETAFAATLPTIRPNGDGTQTGITFSTGTVASVLIDDDPDTPTTSDYTQQTRNSNGDDTSYITIDNMPSDFSTMTTLDIKADVSNSSGGNDIVTLKVQIFESEGGAALTDQLTLSTDTDASGFKTGTFALQGNNNKTVWDGAFMLFTWTYARSGPSDVNFVRLTATELNGTYAQAAAVSAPTVTSSAATSVTATTSTLNGNVTATGGENVSPRGFAWGTNSNLSGGDTATTSETVGGPFGTGAFSTTTLVFVGNTTYYFRAYATNSGGTGYSTPILNFLTLPNVPGTPTYDSTTATTTGVSWTAPTGGSSTYTLNECSGGSCTLFSGISGTATTTYSLTGNTTYDYAVRGTNATGDGLWSATSSVLTLPNVPGNPTYSSVTSSSMTVDWTAPTGGASTYKLERCITSTNTCTLVTGIAGTSQPVSSLSPNTSYDFAVRGTNATGDGLWSATTTQLTAADAPTVSTQAASGIGQTSATLNGSIDATGGAGATVRGFAWGTNSDLSGGDTATTTDTAGQPFGTGAFTESSLTLTCNTTYYSRAYATNSGGTGYGAISASFTTSACDAPPAASDAPRRAMRLFEGLRVKFVSGRIIVNQTR
jgi:hypothetical protein